MLATLLAPITTLLAQAPTGLSNPALKGDLGNNLAAAEKGTLLFGLISGVLGFVMVIATLLVLLNFIQAAIDWIGSGGDTSKVQKARDRIIQSVIGLIILVASFAIWSFLQAFLRIDLDFTKLFVR